MVSFIRIGGHLMYPSFISLPCLLFQLSYFYLFTFIRLSVRQMCNLSDQYKLSVMTCDYIFLHSTPCSPITNDKSSLSIVIMVVNIEAAIAVTIVFIIIMPIIITRKYSNHSANS